ncbi:MAG: hypothetical protein AAGE01_07435 [Pseudomonadota bacterium]
MEARNKLIRAAGLALLTLGAVAQAQVGTGPEDAECGNGVVDERPDRFFTCEALQSFSKGFDTHALELFKRASLWGSKQAQYRVGLMTMGGIGTDADAIEGAAWLLLANERNNREITDRLNQVMSSLEQDQRRIVENRAAELREKYGDFAALDRRATWVRRQKIDMTGSRAGRAIGSSLVAVSGAALGGGAPVGAQNSGTIGVAMGNQYDQYEIELRNIVTSVEYRDFEVIEADVEPAADEADDDR